MKDRAWTKLSQYFKADLMWFIKYAEQANSLYMCPQQKPLLQIECDLSLCAGGGNGGDAYYTWEYTPVHTNKFPEIFMLEVINIVVAYKTLVPQFNQEPADVIIWTDNISFALQSGKPRTQCLGHAPESFGSRQPSSTIMSEYNISRERSSH